MRSGGGGDNRPRSAASLRHQTFDSNCIELRVRGNAWQVHEKYQALARDAQGSGDRVAAENFLQHAEHYFRIIEAINEATALEQRQRGGAPLPYGGQPETPTNYYGADGVPPVTAAGAAPVTEANGGGTASASGAQQAPAPSQEAEVQVRQPTPSPFFSTDEIDTLDNGPQSLVARR